ncbi:MULTISPECIES: DUF2642 domain-containing protein [Bacillaceae]|uniref:DUF2642 domain-containing protein n=1 Tax=Domibacillus aminovorans TaxID=29332 RepID=A0A177KI50_9BACI|nr:MULTISPECIES: DUF2642 domain-containing protein [Bacillaceae]OAH52555.1 hypothetical protein AWH48_14230 [Domibacillus aminovorans]
MSSPYFSETLRALIGYSIGIFSNDGILIKGSLVDVKEDYIILQNEKEEHFYHHLNQIKSVSKNTKDIQTNKINHDYLQAEKLQEILEQCKQRWVTINCYNDQVLTGFLSKVFEDHLILISGEEKVIMQNSYISTIFSGFYEEGDSNATNNSIENGTSTNSETEATDYSNENEASAANETEATDRLDALQHDDEVEQKEELDDDQVELVNSSFETSEGKASEMNSFTADSSLRKNRVDKSSFKEKEIEEIDYTLYDRKLRSNLVTRKKRMQMPRDEEESNPSAKSKKNIRYDSGTFSRLKDLQSQTYRKNKKLKYSKKDGRLQAEEKQSVIQTTKSKKNIRYDSGTFSRLKDLQSQTYRKNKKLKYSKKDRRLQAEEKQSVIQTTVQVAEEKQDFIQPVWTQEEKEKMLETQYYSLMKQAEKSQNFSLMKQAQKDYMKLKEKRMHRERIKY